MKNENKEEKTKNNLLKKRMLLSALALSVGITLSGCNDSTKKSEKEDIVEENIPYTVVILKDNTALIYDLDYFEWMSSTGSGSIIKVYTKNYGNIYLSIQDNYIFKSHKNAEIFASQIVGDNGKIVCMDYKDHDVVPTLKYTK